MPSTFQRWICLFIFTFFLGISIDSNAQNEPPESINQQYIPAHFSHLYIVFAGPYPASPSSAFGHLFFLIEPDSSASTPLQLWPAVNYAANVDGYSGFSTLSNGALGRLKGSFEILPFYKKLKDYSYTESRDLWLFPIQLTTSEKERFALFINDSQGSYSQYRFTDKNCATRVYEALYHTFEETPNSHFFVLPQQVLNDGLLAPKISPPLWIENMEDQLLKIYSITETADLHTAFLDSADNNSRVRFLKTYEWLYNNHSATIDQSKIEFIQQLRYQVAQQPSAVQGNFLQSKSFTIHNPAKLNFGYGYNRLESHYLKLGLRFGLHDFSDKTGVYPKFDFVNMLSLNIHVDQSSARFQDLWLFKQTSRQPASYFRSPPSWGLGLGGKRYFLQDRNVFALGLFTTVGQTFSLINNRWASSFLININPVFITRDKWAVIFDPELEQRLFVSSKAKAFLSISNPITSFNADLLNPTAAASFYFHSSQNVTFSSDVSFNSSYYNFQLGLMLNFGY